jgi:hypothetical protein
MSLYFCNHHQFAVYSYSMVDMDEHIIKGSICGRVLIIKDTINNVVAFLRDLKFDHGIIYTFQRMAREGKKIERLGLKQ